MSHDPLMDPPQSVEYGSLKSYIIGFILSIALTLASYYLVIARLATGWVLDVSVGILAIAQALVQLILFLNLLREAKPRWNLIVFLFMLLIVVIVVVGSIWIMDNLNYNLMVE
jgi:cytochrome o ubiquinol oxidase operon protein cyoD